MNPKNLKIINSKLFNLYIEDYGDEKVEEKVYRLYNLACKKMQLPHDLSNDELTDSEIAYINSPFLEMYGLNEFEQINKLYVWFNTNQYGLIKQYLSNMDIFNNLLKFNNEYYYDNCKYKWTNWFYKVFNDIYEKIGYDWITRIDNFNDFCYACNPVTYCNKYYSKRTRICNEKNNNYKYFYDKDRDNDITNAINHLVNIENITVTMSIRKYVHFFKNLKQLHMYDKFVHPNHFKCILSYNISKEVCNNLTHLSCEFYVQNFNETYEEFFKQLKNLTHLTIKFYSNVDTQCHEQDFIDISLFKYLTKLEYLEFDHKDCFCDDLMVSDFSPLKSLVNLKTLVTFPHKNSYTIKHIDNENKHIFELLLNEDFETLKTLYLTNEDDSNFEIYSIQPYEFWGPMKNYIIYRKEVEADNMYKQWLLENAYKRGAFNDETFVVDYLEFVYNVKELYKQSGRWWHKNGNINCTVNFDAFNRNILNQ